MNTAARSPDWVPGRPPTSAGCSSAWLLVLVVFGVFAIHVENALAGAGWQASNSQSVAARAVIEKDFAGLGATGLQVVDRRSPRPDRVGPRGSGRRGQGDRGAAQRSPGVHRRPTPGRGLHLHGRPDRDHHRRMPPPTPTRWWRRPTRSNRSWRLCPSSGVSVTLTGDSALWANFNTANRSAMLRSEMLSWPVTIIILVIAFGSLVAAGLPLLLTMAGLLVAAGALVITTKFTPVSIWALNFALMFALALGIDYALFLVMRFRSALERRGAEPGDREAIVASVAETVDTAGKAVAFSALTVLASLAAILIVPSPAFRSMAFGIMLSVVAVLAATLTLLPAVLGKLGTNINKGTIRLGRGGPKVGEGPLDRRLHRWGKFLWKHPFPAGAAALVLLLLAAAPDHRDADQHAVDHHRAAQRQRPGRLRPGDQCLRCRAPRGPCRWSCPPASRRRPWPSWPTPPGWPAPCPVRPTPGGPSTRSSRPPDPRPPRPARPSTTSARSFRPAR